MGAPGRLVDTTQYYGPPGYSLSEQVAGIYDDGSGYYDPGEGLLGIAQEPVLRRSSNSALRIKAPKTKSVTKSAPTFGKPQKSMSPANSATKPRETKKEALTCKARPIDNKPKAGGGSGKRFVPWC